jgi:hypothetical protein
MRHRPLLAALAITCASLTLASCPKPDKAQGTAPTKAPKTKTKTAQPAARTPATGIPAALSKRYPTRDLARFAAYRITNTPLFSVTGRGSAVCKPAWVVGVEAASGKLLVGRELLRKRLAAKPAPKAKELARLTLDLLLQQRGRELLNIESHRRRCKALGDKAKALTACQPDKGLAWVAPPKLAADTLTFWRKPCMGHDADRVVLTLADLSYSVASTAEITEKRRIGADPIGWVREQVMKRAPAGPQRDALKKVPKQGCKTPGKRQLLQAIVNKNPHHIVREKATIMLARCPHPSTTALLMRTATRDGHVNVRQAAVDILGALGDKRALPLLRKLAADKRAKLAVRYAAKRSLKQLGGGGTK